MNRLVAGELSRLAGMSLQQRSIHMTPLQSSVFMKRTKKLDPAIAKQREERKRKKLTREIRLMQQHSKKPKPLDEMYIDIVSARNLSERHRPYPELSFDELERRAVVQKQYSNEQNQLYVGDRNHIISTIQMQARALTALKAISEELYEAAVQPDSTLVSSSTQGPPETPPIDDYECPDGDYVDTTRTWQ